MAKISNLYICERKKYVLKNCTAFCAEKIKLYSVFQANSASEHERVFTYNFVQNGANGNIF